MQQSREEIRYLPQEVQAVILSMLKKKFGDDVEIVSCPITSEENRRNVIARIYLKGEHAPASIIFKQSLPKKSDPDYVSVTDRFSRDWAGLEFTNKVDADAHTVPKFYDSNKQHRFILIEDLGKNHVSLVNSLLVPGNEERSIAALHRYMSTLGKFHACSFNRTGEYLQLLREVNPDAKSPTAELQADLKHFLQEFDKSLKQLGLTMTVECRDEIHQVMNAMFMPGPFTVLIHGDIAPDNVFDHESTQSLQLIDFEIASVRNALMDGVYLRMSIPTGWCAKTIPNDLLEDLEKTYRSELGKKVDAANDNAQYKTVYTQACGFWAVVEMAFLNNKLTEDIPWGGDAKLKPPLVWDAENNSGRSRFLTRLQAFIDVNKEHNVLPNLAKMAETLLAAVNNKKLWPDAKPLDTYPAFSQRLELMQQESSSSREHNQAKRK